MSSWPFMACDEMRKRNLNDRINATILKSIKKRKDKHGIIQIKLTNDMRKINTLLVICIRNLSIYQSYIIKLRKHYGWL